MSILTSPERGPWGDPNWRGNCSGSTYQHLFHLLRPRTFVDPMVGSGTSTQVAQEMNIEALGLDLHSGFNILRHRIRDHLPAHWKNQADLMLSHPPYHDMVVYSGSVWGEPHPDDLSRCASVDDFLEKLTQAVLNQRDATRQGGVYGVILGDLRRQGEYHALTSDLQAALPRRERRAILIKTQHNVSSAQQAYGHLRFGRIEHEYVLLCERSQGDVYYALAVAQRQQQADSRRTWKAVVRHAVMTLSRTRFTVNDVYNSVFDTAPERVRSSPHWQAKVRQVLQQLPEVKGDGRGTWTLCQAA